MCDKLQLERWSNGMSASKQRCTLFSSFKIRWIDEWENTVERKSVHVSTFNRLTVNYSVIRPQAHKYLKEKWSDQWFVMNMYTIWMANKPKQHYNIQFNSIETSKETKRKEKQSFFVILTFDLCVLFGMNIFGTEFAMNVALHLVCQQKTRNNGISNHKFIQIHMLNTCGSNYRFNTLHIKLLVALNCVTVLVVVSFFFILWNGQNIGQLFSRFVR